ncbi:MAG: TonB-dependent receptor [Sphingobacteriales bacterium]|nr:MAG: TonB-dependent receptor [Sphingobacteriales bacterium]TAF79999.1 MAG: TonB-dependent receptor [Sphingobacteriales bacterium]
MMMKFFTLLLVFIFFTLNADAQTASLNGKVKNADNSPIQNGIVALKNTRYNTPISQNGDYSFPNIPQGNYTVVAFALGKQNSEQNITLDKPINTQNFTLQNLTDRLLNEVVVLAQQDKAFGIVRLNSVQNFTLYEGKKNEIIVLKNLVANTATNNPRQIFGQITGLNIWESDGAGLQLGIGGRGLSPNRTSHFNTRQNGYDISADALGYPESYYTPPAEAIEKIEVIRGASSLQYGTQFGGTVNFQFKKGVTDTPIEYVGRQTYGINKFINSFNSLGGTVNNGKLNYYTFYQRRQGNGFRPNSAYNANTAFFNLNYSITPKTNIVLEYTYTHYLAQQAGGLTDALFDKDPTQSLRSRNWFKVDWNLFALHISHKFSANTELNVRNFGLIASRQSLGNLDRINVADFNQDRDFIKGTFNNLGNETRLVHRYNLGKQKNVLLAGARIYAGTTTATQGLGDNQQGPNFMFQNPNNVEGSDYKFPNYNISLFAEHIFNINNKFSITPGIRWENIKTFANGYYRYILRDNAGNIVVDKINNEKINRNRSFAIAGLGFAYKLKPELAFYGNISQNYRAINFSDLRIQNLNFVVDSNLTDEKGFTADVGIKGNINNIFTYEITAFYLYYNNRIGQILKTYQAPLFLDYRFRTNVAASRNIGVEYFASVNLARLNNWLPKKHDFTLFINTSIIDAKYIKSKEASIQNKQVEMVPPFIFRSGLNYLTQKWRAGFQINYVAQHFSDATNAPRTSSAVEGIIHAYTVADVTAAYNINRFLTLEASCNNLLDAKYFTRRAESYPGPGIIPADFRSYYVTLQVKLPYKLTSKYRNENTN